MKEEQDYIRDIREMRTIMERSSKFTSLSGLASIIAGIYALVGAYISWAVFDYRIDGLQSDPGRITGVIVVALVVLIFSVGTAFLLSQKKAQKKGERVWNATSRRLLNTTAVPLVTGGMLILILLSNSLTGLILPATLIFYGLALYNASRLTYEEVRSLGIIQIILGLLSAWIISYGLLFWVLGFGVAHIVYGIYLHYKYER
ncbi:MAG: hypothetical protein EOO04_07795 [Chitinophagaceae bacterium]|nr:MAG: hypothetical protein EOO04_07795 [Chitinophagaceae bacterium]